MNKNEMLTAMRKIGMENAEEIIRTVLLYKATLATEKAIKEKANEIKHKVLTENVYYSTEDLRETSKEIDITENLPI